MNQASSKRTKAGYRHHPEDQANSPLKEPDDFVIQVDDEGTFWDKSSSSVDLRALQHIAECASRTNTIVTVFIHGWHHNAHPADRDLNRFADAQRDLRQALTGDVFRRSRELLTGTADVRVIGIYVGRRGRSLPGVLDYLTPLGRQAAAKRVGDGDLKGFMGSLNAIYERANARGTATFMGLVSFGHSFGGQVLFNATGPLIIAELERAARGEIESGRPLQGFGDLVVLANPALDAKQFEDIHHRGRSIAHGHSQLPLVLVLSAITDKARARLYKWLRTMKQIFRGGKRTALETVALGEFAKHRTHTIMVEEGATGAFDPAIFEREPERIRHYDLTSLPSIGGVTLKPEGEHHAFNPFIVAAVKVKVISGHSDFKSVLYQFLTSCAAIAQAKRMLLRRRSDVPVDISGAEPRTDIGVADTFPA